MLNTQFINEISSKISALIASTPAPDIERNLRALLQGAFARMDLVTREEFEVQTEILAKTRRKLETLEQKLAELEARLPVGE
jgi:ubiquinone biosynthesis accessory factor UbiK